MASFLEGLIAKIGFFSLNFLGTKRMVDVIFEEHDEEKKPLLETHISGIKATEENPVLPTGENSQLTIKTLQIS